MIDAQPVVEDIGLLQIVAGFLFSMGRFLWRQAILVPALWVC